MHSNNIAGPEFLISKERLVEILVDTANPVQQYCGGVENIISALKTNLDTGILGDQRDLLFRRQAFGSNSSFQEWSSQKTTKRLKQVFLEAFKDTTIILLLCCAMLSFVIGIKKNGLEEGLIDGAMVFLAISLVITFGAIFKFFKTKWMIKKSMKKHMKKVVRVVRNGKVQRIPESEVVVGDIVWLHTGDHVPADGIFIDGANSFELNDGLKKNIISSSCLFTGAKVVNGHCRMLVTSVGENTERSRLIRLINDDDHQEPKLQFLDAIDKTNSKLEKIWLSLSLLLLTVQLVRCFMSKPSQTDKDRNLDTKGMKNTMEDLMNESIKVMKKERSKANGFVTLLCILLFATRDGLPLAVFLSLLYASNRMKSWCEATIQKHPASATIGLVTTICIGKTNDLVLQYTKMAELWVGFKLIDDVHRQVDNEILDFLREGILLHGQEDHDSLFYWARAVLGFKMNMEDSDYDRDFSMVVRYEASDHHMDTNLSCLLISGEDKDELHVHWKGAPELIVFMCSHYYSVDGSIETLDDEKRRAFLRIVDSLVASSCSSQCCFAFACKRELLLSDHEDDEKEEIIVVHHQITLKNLEHGLILLGLVGLKNPYTPEVREAIQESQVEIKLMVEDDINTARIMAINCGLLRPEEVEYNINIGAGSAALIIDAADFRTSSEEDRMNMLDNIKVMANSSPVDKLLLVQCLRRKGEIVAATASSIRDSPLLKEADVGIFMGDIDKCAEAFSKEDGDILVPAAKKFSQIPEIIKLGRRVCENLEKFIRLQLTLEISAFTINFIALVVMSTEEYLSSFQVLWINLIMEVLGALAMAITTIHTETETETESSEIDQVRTKSKPVYNNPVIITRAMYGSIAFQSLFQVAIILIMGMKGKAVFQVSGLVLKTMIFNCYAFCQVFLLLQAIELKKNDVFVGLFTGESYLFLGIVAIIGILQVALVQVMAVVAHWATLDVKQWLISIGIASFSVPLSCAANWMLTKRQRCSMGFVNCRNICSISF